MCSSSFWVFYLQLFSLAFCLAKLRNLFFFSSLWILMSWLLIMLSTISEKFCSGSQRQKQSIHIQPLDTWSSVQFRPYCLWHPYPGEMWKRKLNSAAAFWPVLADDDSCPPPQFMKCFITNEGWRLPVYAPTNSQQPHFCLGGFCMALHRINHHSFVFLHGGSTNRWLWKASRTSPYSPSIT